jgi:transcriptional regulator with XRE-family HTH domain
VHAPVSEKTLEDERALAASLVLEARIEAGLTQAELARRAGVPRSVVSAVEHERRQPSLPTLLKILRGAGLGLRVRLAPYDDHDDVLEALTSSMDAAERQEHDRRHEANVAAFAAARPVSSRVR